MKKPKPGPDLFSASDTLAAPGAGGSALRMSASASAGPLSAAQKRFNRLLAGIDKLKAQIADAQALADTFRPRYASALVPLHKQQQAFQRRMALWLDERLACKGLTPAQRRSMAEIVCSLCEDLAASGDAAMAALHDRHSAQSLRDKQQQESAEMRAMMKAALGERLTVDLQGDWLDPIAQLEALLKATREQIEHEQAQHQQARARKKPSAAQLKAEQQASDAQTVLRQVFRQLASALHPDRERDPAEHQRKTALMSQANAAYGRQDLVALLHLQQRIEQLEPGAMAQLPEEKMAAMTTLLKRQADALEAELFERREQLRQEFDLDFYQTPTAAALQTGLAMQEEALKHSLAQMAQDLAAVQDDASLKRWLKLQRQLARHYDDF